MYISSQNLCTSYCAARVAASTPLAMHGTFHRAELIDGNNEELRHDGDLTRAKFTTDGSVTGPIHFDDS